MIKDNEALEKYLQEIENEIRQSVPEWDKDKQWKFLISERPISKREMIDYDTKIMWVGGATLTSAFSGNEDVREEILTYLLSIVRVLKIIH